MDSNGLSDPYVKLHLLPGISRVEFVKISLSLLYFGSPIYCFFLNTSQIVDFVLKLYVGSDIDFNTSKDLRNSDCSQILMYESVSATHSFPIQFQMFHLYASIRYLLLYQLVLPFC